MHVSNRHLDLVPVVLAAVQELPGVEAVVAKDRTPAHGYDRSPSEAVLITRSDFIDQLSAWPDAEALTPTTVAAWTDDYSDILSALWREYSR